MQIILLSGGSGKRLWPLSNNEKSKQFLTLLEKPDGTRESMLQRVVRQIKEAGLEAPVTLATNALQEDLIASQLGSDVNMVLEPERRDTFPAIALACSYLSLENGVSDDEVVVIMPCDSYAEEGYFHTLGRMAKAVEAGRAELVLMGIKPSGPSSKFGYIVPESLEDEVMKVNRFTEKPAEEKAVELLAEGALWNGGVFAFKLGYMMDIVRKNMEPRSFEDLRNRYSELPKISFDYEVVEKAGSVAMVRYDGKWKDLGTWNALTEELSEKVLGNATLGPHCENVHVINELDVPVFVEGLKDVVVVASSDGILVCSKEASENIKKYVENL